ncbi:MAG: hemolysin family protein [Actinomycetaceae bacterium]|nr:hemolysin family protein [Actinomycetaceae bacterium]
MSAAAIPEAALFFFALVFFAAGALCGGGIAALDRITVDEASDMPGGERIVAIVSRRQAATFALVAMRIVFACLATMCATLALSALLATWWEVMLAVVIVALVGLVVAAFVSPTRVGVRRPEAVIKVMSGPLWVATLLASLVVRERESNPEVVEEQESQLAVMVERVSQSEVLDENDRELLQSVFDLNHTLVREVMVPRTDMVSIEADVSLREAMSLFTRSGFSRVPVIGQTVDDLLGVVYLKDVLRRSQLDGDVASLSVSDVMREPVFVPETKLVDDLMRDMQADQVHIALVVDEYGGIAGLVTIEDIVEELVGEISDEHDHATAEVDDLGEGAYRVPARLPIGEFGDLFGIRLEDDDVDTVGGLFAKLLGRVPIAGSETSVEGIHLAAERFHGRRRRLATIVARRHEEGGDDD